MAILRVVGAAVLRNGLCLVAKRGPTMSLAGKWEFPGGKVESSECPQDALARELVEELGIHASIGEFLARATAIVARRTIQLDVYAAELPAGEPKPSEHEETRWLGADELANLEWAEADVAIVPAVQRYMRLIASRNA